MGIFRLFLAFVVAIGHWRVFALGPNNIDTLNGYLTLGFNAGYAVFFFYMISGFLITYTLSKNYTPDTDGYFRFYRGRFVRIFSVYWPLAIILFVFADGAWRGFVNSSTLDRFTQIFILGQDWSTAFSSYPMQHSTAAIVGFGQSWTLGAELTFYLMAPWLMRSWKTAAAIMGASLAARFAFVIALGDITSQPIWNYHFAGTSIVFFMLGHLTCRAGLAFSALRERFLAWAFPASLAVMTFGPWTGFDSPRFWVSVLLFAISLPAFFNLTKDMRVSNYIGNLSYPFYLVHLPISVWWSSTIIAWTGSYGPSAATWTYIAIVLVCSITVHHTLEPWTARLMTMAWRIRALRPAV